MTSNRNIFKDIPLSGQQEAQWISLSDLMTGLMMLFLLIAVSFMLKVEADAAKARDVAKVYDATRSELYEDLKEEFKNDLEKWGAELDKKNLSIRFEEPEVLFKQGDPDLQPKFQEILKDFFPRYLKIVASERYHNSIEEIRIEGHTSSVWNTATNQKDAYFLNMELSQARTRSALRFVMSLPSVGDEEMWLRQKMTANGLSSSKLILNDGKEDQQKSQRVEFRIRTDADRKIESILGTAQ